MIEKIYIARHGFRLNWVTMNWKSATGLPRDPPLAGFGETQAQELADYFLSLPVDERPTAIFSSPYYRCLQTSKPTATALDVPLYVEHGLSEWYSPVVPNTGLHPRPASASVLQTHFPQVDPEAWSTVWYPSRKGEDVQQVHNRTDGFLNAFVPTVEHKWPQHRCILLVSHAATVITLAQALVGDRNLPIRVGCCSLTEAVRKADGTADRVIGGWDLIRVADGSHLEKGASRDWGFEDIEISDGQVVGDPGVPGTENEIDDPVGLQIDIESPSSAARL